MATHVVINARTRKVSASLEAPGEGTIIFAVDLAGDTWHDFCYFADKARDYENVGAFAQRNRYLRSAVSNLFSHLDAVVSDVYEMLPGYVASGSLSLKSKMFAIKDDAKRSHKINLPYINIDLKLIRDIISHPSITKVRPGQSYDTLAYDSTDVYGTDIKDVYTVSSQLDHWLNSVCQLYGYERFYDTEKLCRDFAKSLASTIGEPEPDINPQLF